MGSKMYRGRVKLLLSTWDRVREFWKFFFRNWFGIFKRKSWYFCSSNKGREELEQLLGARKLNGRTIVVGRFVQWMYSVIVAAIARVDQF